MGALSVTLVTQLVARSAAALPEMMFGITSCTFTSQYDVNVQHPCPAPDSNKPPIASYQDRLALVLTPGARAKSGLQRLLFTYSVLIGFAAMRLV